MLPIRIGKTNPPATMHILLKPLAVPVVVGWFLSLISANAKVCPAEARPITNIKVLSNRGGILVANITIVIANAPLIPQMLIMMQRLLMMPDNQPMIGLVTAIPSHM